MSAGVVEVPAVRTALPLRVPGVPRDAGGASVRFPPETSGAGAPP